MTYIKLPQLHKILAIALALVGAYGTIPVAHSDSSISEQSAIPEVSTTTRAHLPVSKLSLPDQAIAQSLLNKNTLVPQPKRGLAESVSQNLKQSEEGAPGSGSRRGAGTHAEQRPRTGTFRNTPSDQGAPAPPGRPGAGSRGGRCPQVNKILTPLVPVTAKTLRSRQASTTENPGSESNIGLTVAKHPIFWFYIPFPLTAERPVEFVLEDDQGKEFYQTTLTKPGISSGVVGLKLPPTAPPLEVNKTYRWYFYVYCTPERTDEPAFAEGSVKRVPINSTLTRQLEQAKPQQRFELYAKASLWHEAVTSLGELRLQNPDDVTLKNEWTTLLEAMNLDAIAKEPISSMLTPES
ncbi:MAG TPA: hypothetical protein DCE56_04880 [Cyanobacteria bacterium UBA8553]|nr:hypothetical protein [Cyanobacteria bacterium UBA8553]HAJ64411.1 hypothetical protein [Cyanobacteria bacterium UBA8543]